MGDSTNAATIGVSHARTNHCSSHVKDNSAVHIIATTKRSGRARQRRPFNFCSLLAPLQKSLLVATLLVVLDVGQRRVVAIDRCSIDKQQLSPVLLEEDLVGMDLKSSFSDCFDKGGSCLVGARARAQACLPAHVCA